MTTEIIKRVLALRAAEQRRPGITSLQAEIRAANPRWNESRVQAEAKVQWQKLQAKP